MDDQDFRHLSPKIEQYRKDHNDVRMYMEIVELGDINLTSLLSEFKDGIKMWDDFPKVAISGKEQWMDANAEVADFLAPGVDVKYFEPIEKDKAMNWLK